MEKMPFRTARIKSGHPIVTEDTWAYYAYVILSGKGKVVKNIEGDQEVIGILKEGDVLGEMSIIGGAKRTASVIADGDVEVAMIPKDTIISIMDTLSPTTKSKLTALTSDLTHITHISAILAHELHDIEKIKVKRVDVESLNRNLTEEMKDVPDIYKQIFITLANRLNLGIETLAKLSMQVENAAKISESISVAISKQP
ncbi:MAG: cyclic nucleotide-binding domain-containing protein [Nitrospirae bacterium]|nr:cyclic nucleotide-binding domain-containing protein [Nitrospirota bacterium]